MSLVVEIKVIPNASKARWTVDGNRKLKCYLKSPPVDGKANSELIDLLRSALKLTKKDIEIVSGLTGRQKRVALATSLTWDQLLNKLGLEQQLTLVD